MFNLKTGGIC